MPRKRLSSLAELMSEMKRFQSAMVLLCLHDQISTVALQGTPVAATDDKFVLAGPPPMHLCLSLQGATFGRNDDAWKVVKDAREDMQGSYAEALLPSGDIVFVMFGGALRQ